MSTGSYCQSLRYYRATRVVRRSRTWQRAGLPQAMAGGFRHFRVWHESCLRYIV
jgi:hypothetical protein